MTDKELGAHVQKIIKQEGWTQRGVANAIGMREGMLSKILTGRRPMTVLELCKIARVLRVSPNILTSPGW